MWFKDILTSMDGQSFAIIKVLGFAVVVVFLFLAVASFFTGKAFDMQAFGIGAGAAVGAMGMAIKLTETSEPKPPEPSKDEQR